jgi:glutamyl-tRNA synthetase/nondiscriminating glutamyl-tRNA synthetase
MATDQVRVRFAPSPTGQLHVGNARTALFNWLYARQRGGVNVLRIEDTDVERSEQRYETQLLDDLKWLGVDWDEGPDVAGPYGPYRQSDRTNIYQAAAELLIREQKAYYCFCTAEELERDRQQAMAEQRQPIYSGKCRGLGPAEAERRRASGEAAAIRLKIPEHPIKFFDIVRGQVEFPSESVSDPIIMRSNGLPVYNYVVVIDDAEMKITHVIRGDDHLSNTPKQVALYEALGLPVPKFAHLSTILGPDRERLSKRHGATSIANFRDMGILPEALMNYLALLGWAPSGGTRETFTPKELIKEFSLKRVTPSSAIFDMEKLFWLNRHYLKQSSPERTAQLALPFFQHAGLLPEQPGAEIAAWFRKLLALLVPYVNKLDELQAKADELLRYPRGDSFEPAIMLLHEWPNVESVLTGFAERVQHEASLTPERFKAIMTEIQAATGFKGKDLYHPIRIVLIGSSSGPEFDKLIPLLEEASRLPLPMHVKSIRERVAEFMDAWRNRRG